MSWLRLDDGFASHPKVAGLTDREFRVWVRLLLFCARYRTKGFVDIPVVLAEVGGLTRPMLDRLKLRGLLDQSDDPERPGLIVHDWLEYNDRPDGDYTAAERQARKRARDANRDGARDSTRDGHRDSDRDSRAGTRARSRPLPRGGREEQDRHRPAAAPARGAGSATGHHDEMHAYGREWGWTEPWPPWHETTDHRGTVYAVHTHGPNELPWITDQKPAWPPEGGRPPQQED